MSQSKPKINSLQIKNTSFFKGVGEGRLHNPEI